MDLARAHKRRLRFRRLESGDIAYFPSPLAREGYVVTSDDVELRLLHALRREEWLQTSLIVLVVVVLSAVGPPTSILHMAVLVVVFYGVSSRLVEALAVGPIRRELPLVEDRRRLVHRYRLAFFGTPRDGLRTVASYAAALVFMIPAAGLVTSTNILWWTVGMLAVCLIMLTLWLSELD